MYTKLYFSNTIRLHQTFAIERLNCPLAKFTLNRAHIRLQRYVHLRKIYKIEPLLRFGFWLSRLMLLYLYLQNRWTAKRHKRTHWTIGVLTLWTGTQQRDHGIWDHDSMRNSSFGEMVQRRQQDIFVLWWTSHDTAAQRRVHRQIWQVSHNRIFCIDQHYYRLLIRNL